MADFFYEIDLWLFQLFNGTCSNAFFDKLMPFITDLNHWIIAWTAMFVWLFWKGGKKGRIAAIALILTVVVTDQLNSGFLKELFGRIRPCHVLDDINLLINCGGGKSFPSSHAANMYAVAVILSFYFRQYRYVYFFLAAAIAFSRIYVGVHYPFDVMGGAVVGLITGNVILLVFNNIKFLKVEEKKE